MVEPTKKETYKINLPHVEERYHAKPVPKNVVQGITRLEYLLKNYESYMDKEVTVAGWARTCR